MNTIKRVILTCLTISILIFIFILVLKINSFTHKKLEGYVVENYRIDKTLLQNILLKYNAQKELSSEIKVGITDYPFSPGEKLQYFIYSTRIKVGKVDITYLGKKYLKGVLRDVILLEASALGFSDREEIYGNIENFTPVRVERKIKLFGENIDIVEGYDENTNEVLIIRKAKKTTVQRIISKDKMSNIILLLYHYRSRDKKYKIGEKLAFNLPTQKLEMLVDKETSIKVPKGEFEAIFVKSEPSRFKVWFSKDQRIPLRIQGAIGFGNTYLDLKEIETFQ